MSEKEFSFEEAFSRLEKILEMMNSSAISLDDSLKLYEEAGKLAQICSKRLHDAEQKIEVLIKKQNGEIAFEADNNTVVKEALGTHVRSPISQ